ncbi:MAG: DUF3164 family protein [Marinifilaceae bacterium]
MNLNALTPEQRKALAMEALEAERNDQRKKEEERGAYKDLVSNIVDDLFPALLSMSEGLAEMKQQVYSNFAGALELKRDLYDVKDGQNSHTFTNKGANRRIVIGNNMVDFYDDTVNEGVAIVKEYIAGLAKDDNSSMLVSTIMKLLSRDQKGTLKPSRVLQLRQMAEKSGSERFIDGVKIIESAYKPVPSKTFVRAELKDDKGEWKSVPLGMTEANG